MPAVVSYEYLTSIKGAASGLATLDGTSKIPIAQIPGGAVETYKGVFANSAAIIAAYPSGSIADYAWSTADSAFWYWNGGLATPAWVNQTITAVAYALLTSAAKVAVPYIIIG